ncbi:MAG: TonB-dependent receptor [Dysgonomonas sp.]|nr:TonB-dependent receptor [Dysgonomonas sp.]
MHTLIKIIFLFSTIILSTLEGYSQIPSFTLNMRGGTLKEILKEIENNSEYTFVFNEKLNMEQRKDISVTRKSLAETLKYIFKGTGINWQMMGDHIVLSKVDKITISGYVTDRNSMETLIGASVSDPKLRAGSFTNSYGYYSIQTAPDSVHLQVSYIGYTPLLKSFFAQKDTIINFRLQGSNTILQDVTIYDTRSFSPSSGSIELVGSEINPIPAAFSENDVVKSFQTIPGVRAGVEGSAGMYVRGGSLDQNLILIDGVPVYNIGHAWGLFSVFNGDAVKKVSLHKGSFPARYSGRLSSILDIRFRDGDMQKFNGSITAGILAARVNIEGPIVKGKTSFSFSARRSYIDGVLRIIRRLSEDPSVPVFYIYDMNAKINHKFSDRSRLYLSYYSGRDKLNRGSKEAYYNESELESQSDSKQNYGWGNDIISLRWNYVFNNRLFMNATVAYNKYKFDFNSRNNDKFDNQEQTYTRFQKSGIKDLQFSTDFEYQPNNNHYIRFGGGLVLHDFSPEMHGYQMREASDNNEEWRLNYYLYDNIKGHEMSIYAEDEFSITKKLKANLGVHFSLFDARDKAYLALQPRLSFGYHLDSKTAVKVSYTKMNQYVNLLSSNTISQPTDLWVPITENLKPMSSHQFTAGAFFDNKDGYKFSAEGFYKRMNNILEYKDGIAWKDASTSWEEYVEPGKGWIYGAELFAQKTQGRLTGWMGYTLSWNQRRFETINRGRSFWAKYDSRHNFNVTGIFKLNSKIDFSASWMYATGSKSTLPLEEYQVLPTPDDPNGYWYWYDSPVTNINSRNNYKMSDTHHLDIEMKYYYSPKKTWTFSVYNIYNRFNSYIARVGTHWNGKKVVFEDALLGIVPSVSFTYKFK